MARTRITSENAVANQVDFINTLKNSVSEAGMRRIVEKRLPKKLSEFEGHSLDEVGMEIALGIAAASSATDTGYSTANPIVVQEVKQAFDSAFFVIVGEPPELSKTIEHDYRFTVHSFASLLNHTKAALHARGFTFSFNIGVAENYLHQSVSSVLQYICAYIKPDPQVISRKRKELGLKYWHHVRSEFFILLCTKDTRYAALRRQLASKGKHTETAVVTTISAAVGSSIGLVAGALVPLVALCLLAVVKVGKEAYCVKFKRIKIGAGEGASSSDTAIRPRSSRRKRVIARA
jgi:hypothetical protein